MLGFVKLYRKFENWEWYKDQNTKAVFIHLLIHANIKPSRFKGYQLQAGELITGRKQLALDLGLSEQNIRTALAHLQDTGEITIKPTNRFSIVTIEKWGTYAGSDCDDQPTTNQQLTNDQPTTNQQLTTEGESKKERKQESKNGGQHHQEIVDAWNALGLNPIRSIKDGTTRLSLLNARLKGYGEEAILEAIEEVGQSEFLQGANKRGWTITFDWLLKPNNFQKVLEGQYRTKLKPAASNSTAEMLENHYRMAEEWANEYEGI